jgi:hypothetical protein
MQLRRVAHHRRNVRVELPQEAHVDRQRRCEQLEGFLDNRLHVQRHALAHPGAAESEDAVDESLTTCTSLHDLIDLAAYGAAFTGCSARVHRIRGSRRGCC